MLLTFFGGDKYHTHCNGAMRKAFVMVTCPTHGRTNNQLVVVNEDNGSHDCYYMLELHSNDLCAVSAWGGFGIFIFIIMLIFIFYFLAGILFNRCHGAQGKFWFLLLFSVI